MTKRVIIVGAKDLLPCLTEGVRVWFVPDIVEGAVTELAADVGRSILQCYVSPKVV